MYMESPSSSRRNGTDINKIKGIYIKLGIKVLERIGYEFSW